jgi:hypothetical protein
MSFEIDEVVSRYHWAMRLEVKRATVAGAIVGGGSSSGAGETTSTLRPGGP